jgi:hypothetical protein
MTVPPRIPPVPNDAEIPIAPEEQLGNEPSTETLTVSTDGAKGERQKSLLNRLASAAPGTAFSYADAACMCNVTSRTISNWIVEGKLDASVKRDFVTAESIRRNLFGAS